MQHLGDVYNQHFETIRADTPALLDEALRLRYQVYCLETGFEEHAEFANGIEYDQFDLFSVHSVIRHKQTENSAANVRLILPRSNKSEFHFPIQELVTDADIQDVVKFNNKNMSEFAEISRFCVSKDFKHRFHESKTIAGVGDEKKRGSDLQEGLQEQVDENLSLSKPQTNGRHLPHLTIALISAVFEMSAEEGVKDWFAVMEPSLLRFLSRYGIDFRPIGAPVEYRGLRQPCYAHADDVALGMWRKRPNIWRFVTRNGEIWPLPEEVKEGKVLSSAS